MPFSFAVVCEAEADFRTATALAERLICDEVEWVDPDLLIGCALWRDLGSGRPYVLWRELKQLCL